MKKLTSLLLLFVISLSCNTNDPKEEIANLNGYWEIKAAELPDGSTKEYRFSEMVDYIVVEENEGFRKKLRPQLGGNFISTDDEEMLEVKVENDSINLYYTTPFTHWKETLISSEEDKLVIKNEDGILYTYSRFIPYSNHHEQTEQ